MIQPALGRAVAITGRGAVSSLGADRRSLWASILTGVSGIAPITRFDTAAFQVKTGAQVVTEAIPNLPEAMAERDAQAAEAFCLALAECALREALHDAGLWDPVAVRPTRPGIALVFGTGLSELAHPLHEIVAGLAEGSGLSGARLTISTACSSSTTAIGLGLELLAMGAAETVVAGGADVLTPEVFAGFHALGVLSRTRCAPFSMPAGTTLGEGAGFVVLERERSARARGATVHALVAGYGLSCDAFHETSPDPKGSGIERAIRAATRDAGITPDQVDYVNAHGSGTQSNDSAEWLGIRRAMGERPTEIPVSSTKGALGHAQGAAGVLEAIVTIEAMTHGSIPPTINFVGPRPHAPPDPVPGPFPRRWHAERAVSVNAAFGGANAAIVLARDAVQVGSARPRRTVRLRSIASADASVAAGAGGGDAMIPATEMRRCDPSARALTAAAARVLRLAGHHVTGERRDRTGLFVGQRRPSPASLQAFAESIEANGLQQLSASAFARIVLNAAAGTCAQLLSLRGPHTVLTTGAASGLTALVLAAEFLATRDDIDTMIAGGVDERGAPSDTWADDAEDGATCVLLSTRGPEASNATATATRPILLAGWALGASADLDGVIARAAPDGLPSATLHLTADPRALTARSALDIVAEAVHAFESGATRHALVTSTVPGTVSAAILFTC